MDKLIRVSVSFFCHDGKGNYLVHKRSVNCRDEHGNWDNGGGGLKFGEKIEDALHREIREEYCVPVLKAEFIGYRDVFRNQNGQDTHWITLDFRAQLDPAEVKNGEPHKIDEMKWVTIEELKKMSPLHSQLPAALEKYQAILI